MAVTFHDPNSASGIKKLDHYLLTRSYITGYQASKDDIIVYAALSSPPSSEYVNASRWFSHIDALLSLSGVSGNGSGVRIEGFAPPAAVEDAVDHTESEIDREINLCKVARFVLDTAEKYTHIEAAIGYIESTLDKFVGSILIHYLKLKIASLKLEKRDPEGCKMILDEEKNTLDNMTYFNTLVYRAYLQVTSHYYKYYQDFTGFYKCTILHLKYTSLEYLSEATKLNLAGDLSLSALLSDDIYNFSELLSHPIMECLPGTEMEWIYYIIVAINEGDVNRYEKLRQFYNDKWIAQPALGEKEKKIMEKINTMCIVEIMFRCHSEERIIPLKVIADKMKISIEDVELLVMKSMSVQLVEGEIDQVEGAVLVRWVKPRVLEMGQIKFLQDRLDVWMGNIGAVLDSVEEEKG